MEKNYINYSGKTHFYINLIDKEYGVRVSVEDTPKASKIIKEILEDRKEQINIWLDDWKNEKIKGGQLI